RRGLVLLERQRRADLPVPAQRVAVHRQHRPAVVGDRVGHLLHGGRRLERADLFGGEAPGLGGRLLLFLPFSLGHGVGRYSRRFVDGAAGPVYFPVRSLPIEVARRRAAISTTPLVDAAAAGPGRVRRAVPAKCAAPRVRLRPITRCAVPRHFLVGGAGLRPGGELVALHPPPLSAARRGGPPSRPTATPCWRSPGPWRRR